MGSPSAEVLEGGTQPKRASQSRRRGLVVLVVLLGATVATLAALVVHYKHMADRVAAQPVTRASSGQTVNPTVTRSDYRLLRGKLAVQLVAVVVPGADHGRLIVAGHLIGGIPTRHYVLAGSECPGGRPHVWAQGVTDTNGNASLTGPVWTLAVSRAYYLSVDPQPLGSAAGAPVTGIEGIWLGEQATPVIGQRSPCL